MKLGICVVYLVKPGDEELLDLHLAQIRKHTRAPFTIYGSVNRLRPELLPRLQEAGVEVVRLPDVPARGSEEHNAYLDGLLARAFADGCSHAATLHVDSFPVADGWAQTLAARLDARTVLAAVKRDEVNDDKPHNSLAFLTREFYTAHAPRLLGSAEDRASPRFREYLAASGCLDDGGVGLGFKVWEQGLAWRPLARSNRAADHFVIGSVYGDLVFHLGATARGTKVFFSDALPAGTGTLKRRLYLLGRRLLLRLPHAWQEALIRAWFPAHQRNQRAHDAIRRQLLRDPDAYLRFVRTGQP